MSWLGKEAMAGVGLADSFNMVIIAFSPRWISAPPWWWPSASASAIVGARAAARQSSVLMTGVALLLAAGIHLAGESIIDVIAGAASPEVKALALSYLQTTVWSYPAAAIALIGSGAERRGQHQDPAADQRRHEYPQYHHQQHSDIRHARLARAGLRRRRAGADDFRCIGAIAILYVLAIGFNPALHITLKSYFTPLKMGILWEVLGIGIPASVESVLFNGGKLLTQMFVAGMGTNVIAGNFIVFLSLR